MASSTARLVGSSTASRRQHRHGKDHLAVLAADVDIAEHVVRDAPDVAGDRIQVGSVGHGVMIAGNAPAGPFAGETWMYRTFIRRGASLRNETMTNRGRCEADRMRWKRLSGHVEMVSNSFLLDSRRSLLHSGHLETIRSDAHAPARMADRAVLIRLTWFPAVI